MEASLPLDERGLHLIKRVPWGSEGAIFHRTLGRRPTTRVGIQAMLNQCIN